MGPWKFFGHFLKIFQPFSINIFIFDKSDNFLVKMIPSNPCMYTLLHRVGHFIKRFDVRIISPTFWYIPLNYKICLGTFWVHAGLKNILLVLGPRNIPVSFGTWTSNNLVLTTFDWMKCLAKMKIQQFWT